jgi:4-amino-4-deoxy-L-arabinose transferase-like glycosyltransferase
LAIVALRSVAVQPLETIRHQGASARAWDRLAIGSIIAGTAFRFVWGLLLHPPLNYVYSDMGGYVERAIRVATGGALSRFDTFYPPGTHLLLALPLWLFGHGRPGLWAGSVLWFFLSAVVPLLAWRVALRLISPPAAAITAMLCAIWPLFITYGGFFLSEIPSIAFLLLMLWLAMRATERSGRSAVFLATLAGLSGGVALAIRPQLVLNVAIAGVILLRKREHRARIAAVAGLALIIPVASVLALNTVAAGRFVGMSENGGLNFFQGHCPANSVTTGNPQVGFLDVASPVAVENDRGIDYVFPTHLAWEQSYFIRQGLRCMKQDPAGQIKVIARNVADLGITSVPWPQTNYRGLRLFVRPANLAYSFALPSIIVLSIFLALWKKRRGERAGEWILILSLVAVIPTAVVFYGDPRFRVPYDVFGLALAGSLVSAWLERRSVRKIHLSPPPGLESGEEGR